jgi:acyl carrier protein
LYIGGDCLAVGYTDATLTAERFIPDPFSHLPGGRLYRTGDRARYLADGNIEFLGRNDNQVKIRGFRIELGEIEAALSKHPAMSEALVMAREDAPGDKRLVAYAVLKPGKTLSPSELRAHLRERLPDYMLPSAFVSLDEMPLTQNGKVDRKRLPKPDGLRPESEESFIAPATELERAIAAIWQDALQVDRVARDDNFFDMGGHSLLMVQVHSRLQQALNKELSMIELFKFPTINSLAQHLTRENGGPDVSKQNQERGKARRESIAARERMKQLNQTKESGRRDSTHGLRGLREPTG